MSNNKPNKYFAFISYKREDEEWAVWFHHELENYHLPATLNGRADLPKEFRPVFRDIDELKAGNLPEQIYNALASSAYLIVICSPNSAKSEWVNKEIRDFIEIGKAKGIDNVRNIFPFIVDGRPHAQNESEECFPKVLLELSENEEIVGGNVNEGNRDRYGNVNESGRDKAFVKVLAGMLPNVAFDDLWNRYEHDKAEEERLKREERERFQRIQSRFVAEKVIDIAYDSRLAQLLALEVLPKSLQNPNRPLTIEAEHALRHAASKRSVTLAGHTLAVNSISFSQDGELVASASDDCTIRIWNVKTGSLVSVIQSEYYGIRSVAFGANGKSLYSSFGEGPLVIWDVGTGKKIRSFAPPVERIDLISVSMDGRKVALSSDGMILILDITDDNVITLKAHEGPIMSIVFSPDGKSLVSTSFDGLIVWDLENGTHASLGLKEGVEVDFGYASFSPDGQLVVFCFDNTLGVASVDSQNSVMTFGDDDDRYVSVSFCDEGKKIVSVSGKGALKVWDVETRQTVCSIIVCSDDVSYAAISVKGDYVGVALNNNSILVWETFPSVLMKSVVKRNKGFTAVSYSPDGKQFVTADISGKLTVWSANGEKVIREMIGHTDRVWSVSYSPNCKLIVSSSYDETIRIWDSESGETINVLDAKTIGLDTAFTAASFSPDGKSIAAALYDGHIVVWDVISGIVLHKLKHGLNSVWSVAFSPNGTRVVSASLNRELKIWNLENGTCFLTLKGHAESVNSVVYSSDGKHILSASDDKTIIVWDSNTGEIVKVIGPYVNSGQAYSSQVELSERQASYVDLLNYAGFLFSNMNMSKGRVAASVNYDDSRIVYVANNNTLTIWDAETGCELVTLSGHAEHINSVSFSPDGKQIVSVSADGTIIIWVFPPLQDLIDQTRERFKDRPLTPEERKQYYLE